MDSSARVDLLGVRSARRDAGARNAADPYKLVTGSDGLARPAWAERSPQIRSYYDTEWGVPVFTDQGLYRVLSLLILQGGMRWGAALVRATELGEALEGFDPRRLADYRANDLERLLCDQRVIRNRVKLSALIQNAKCVSALGTKGSFAQLVWAHQPDRTPLVYGAEDVPRQTAESAALAKELRSLGFKFVGPRICYSLFQTAGVVDTHPVGSHRRGVSGLWVEDGTPRPAALPLELLEGLAARTPVHVAPPGGIGAKAGELD